MRFLLLLLLLGCQTAPKGWTFETNGRTLDDSGMPWAYHQALYELEYAKRASEKIAVTAFAGELLDPQLFKVEKPSETQLQEFYGEMKRYLPPDFASNRELIEQYYVKWKTALLKKQYVKQKVIVQEPALKSRPFDKALPSLPARGSAKPQIEVLAVSMLDCDICRERNDYLEKLLSQYQNKAAIRYQVLDSYPGDTSLPHYNLMRELLCTISTSAYWTARAAVFGNPDAAKIRALVPTTEQNAFDACVRSNEPEKILARNNDLANDLYARNLFSIYINRQKIAYPTAEIVEQKLQELIR